MAIMASPHVAAAAALLISVGKTKSPDEVRKVLTKSARDLGKAGFDRTYGHGLIQVHNALTYVSSGPSPTPTPDDTGRNRPEPACWTLNRKKAQCKARSDCKWRRRRKKCNKRS